MRLWSPSSVQFNLIYVKSFLSFSLEKEKVSRQKLVCELESVKKRDKPEKKVEESKRGVEMRNTIINSPFKLIVISKKCNFIVYLPPAICALLDHVFLQIYYIHLTRVHVWMSTPVLSVPGSNSNESPVSPPNTINHVYFLTGEWIWRSLLIFPLVFQ